MHAKSAPRSAFVDGTSVAKDYGVLVINNAWGTVAMNCSKLGLYGGIAMASMLALAPLGCEDPSTGSSVAPDGGGVFQPDGGGSGDANVDPPVASECVPPTKGPTMHNGGSTSDPDNDVWTADGSPHILPFDTTIYKTVTLEPCAEVLIADGKEVTIRGKLVAEGTATKRIHIGAKDAGKPFNNIRTLAPATARFAYTTIDGGGAPGNTLAYLAGTLAIAGDASKPVQEVISVDHVTIDGSASNGLVLTDNAGFAAGSNALVVKNAAVHPMSIYARAVGGIPVGSYTGNGIDQILLPTTSNNDAFTETTTLHDRGVPYLAGHATSGGNLRVDVSSTTPPVTLTIEPGVHIRFKKGGAFTVAFASSTTEARGSVIAVGTAAKPIVFTSNEATPAAGDWLGLHFGDVPTAVNRLDFVQVQYAGGASTSGSDSCPYPGVPINDAAIRFTGPPPSVFITNTTISDSASNGFDRGYRSDTKLDFTAGNTLTNVAGCTQTFPKDVNGACPMTVLCPK